MWDSKTCRTTEFPPRRKSALAASNEKTELWAWPAFMRRSLMGLMPVRPSAARPRGGFAVKELLLVLAVIGSATVCLTRMDLRDGREQRTAWAIRPELIIEQEVPLGPEFACTVRLFKFPAPQRPYYLSRVQFACRDAVCSDPFVIDVFSEVTSTPIWVTKATVRTWTLKSVDAALDYLYEHGKIAIAPSELAEPERTSAISDSLSFHVREATSLDEPLWRCVPTTLQETGILVNTGGTGLQGLHELQGASLSRLAGAIRSAARRDHWKSDDPHALLPMENADDRDLTTSQQHTVAQSLVHRLLEYLPEKCIGQR